MVNSYSIKVAGYPDIGREYLENIIKSNASIFEEYCLSQYGHDRRYSYFGESLEIDELNFDADGGYVQFRVDIAYYDGCKDRNRSEAEDYGAEFSYDEISESIVFDLDETSWNSGE